jgi:hypothetical protein
MIMMPSMDMKKKKKKKKKGSTDPSNQQPCGGHCPVVLQIVWYMQRGPRGTVSEEPHITAATLGIAFVVLRGNYYTTDEGD